MRSKVISYPQQIKEKPLITTVKAEPNVRIRIRGAIIRIQIAETRIRTIIRRTSQQGTRIS